MSEKNNKYTPNLRFPEFSGEWEEVLVKDICDINTGKSNTQDQVVDGLYPFFIRSATPVRSNRYLYDCEAVITIGDGQIGKVFHYVNGKFDLHQRCYMMSNFRGVDCRYFYHFFSNNFYDRAMRLSAKATVDSVRLEMISDMPIFLPPSPAEQDKIASCLSTMDDLIAAQAEKVEALKEKKTGMMQQLFPQPGETTPRLRFPEFTGEWEMKKLGEILVERKEVSVITRELPQLSFTIAEGVIKPEDRKTNQRDFLMIDKDNKRFSVTRRHDIIYNPANVVYGAIHKNNLCDGVVSPIYKIFWTKENADFINHLLRRPEFITQLASRAEGTVTKLKTLKAEAFLDMFVPFPITPSEQQKIASCLSALDDQIAAETEKLTALKDYKKGLMQQLFPQPAK